MGQQSLALHNFCPLMVLLCLRGKKTALARGEENISATC